MDLSTEIRRWSADPKRWVVIPGDRVSLPRDDLDALMSDRLLWRAWAMALEQAGEWR